MKIFNRNALKIIALLSMTIDHIAKVFFGGNMIMVAIGRIAMPIFAFFIAEGFYYTRSKKKFILRLLLFAIISQIPYVLLFDNFIKLNILFTFLISVLFLLAIESVKEKSKLSEKILICIILIACVIITTVLGYFGLIDYGIWGVLLPIAFYLFRDKIFLKYLSFALIMIFLSIERTFAFGVISFNSLIQLFSLLDILLMLCYNGEKGKVNLKYLFYAYYPIHLIVLLVLSILI